jgi:hypothetical protein
MFLGERSALTTNFVHAAAHLFNPCFHSDPARNASVCISKVCKLMSHVPELC